VLTCKNCVLDLFCGTGCSRVESTLLTLSSTRPNKTGSDSKILQMAFTTHKDSRCSTTRTEPHIYFVRAPPRFLNIMITCSLGRMSETGGGMVLPSQHETTKFLTLTKEQKGYSRHFLLEIDNSIWSLAVLHTLKAGTIRMEFSSANHDSKLNVLDPFVGTGAILFGTSCSNKQQQLARASKLYLALLGSRRLCSIFIT